MFKNSGSVQIHGKRKLRQLTCVSEKISVEFVSEGQTSAELWRISRRKYACISAGEI
jgi:hypothetical protein